MAETEESKSQNNEEYDSQLINKKKDDLKDTSKWVLTAFAAIAGLILTGLNFSNVSKIQPPYIYYAIGAFVVAMTAIFFEIYLVTKVLTYSGINEQQIRDFAKDKNNPSGINLNDRLLLDGYTSVDKFFDDYKKFGISYEKAVKDSNKEEEKKLVSKVKALVKTYKSFCVVAGYAMLKSVYFSAIRGVFIFGAIAVVGIAVFIWAIGKTPLNISTYRNPPNLATVTLTEAGKTALVNSLGEKCTNLSSVSVIVLSITDGIFDVVSIPTNECNVVRFNVDSETGMIVFTP